MIDRMQDALRRYRLDDDRPNQETMIERLMRGALDQLGLEYSDQGYVGRYRPDFLVQVNASTVVVECDGPHHRQPRQILKDRRKDAAYAAAGFRVYRFTDIEIRRSAVGCLETLLQRERLAHATAVAPADPADDSPRALH